MNDSADRQALDALLSDIERRPMLTAAQMTELARRRDSGDEHAIHRMVEHNMRLAVNMARKHRGAMPLLDAIQEAALGLLRATRTWNPEKGAFSTYAVWWCHNHLDRARRDYASALKLPHTRTADLRRLRSELNRRPLDAQQAAELLGVSEEIAAALLRAVSAVVRLDAPAGEGDGVSVGDVLVGEEIDFDEPVAQHEMKTEVHALLDQLDDRRAEVLKLRFGLSGIPAQSLAQTGEALGVTKERVRQLEIDALRQLRPRATRAVALIR